MISIYTGLVLLIIGIVLYFISRIPELTNPVTRILYYAGLAFLVIGLIVLLLAIVLMLV